MQSTESVWMQKVGGPSCCLALAKSLMRQRFDVREEELLIEIHLAGSILLAPLERFSRDVARVFISLPKTSELIPDGFNRRGVTFILVEVRQFVWIIFEIVKLPLVELIKMHEFVTLGTNPIMPRHHVDAWILVVVVIDTRSPISWSFTFEERHEGATLHVGGDRCLSHVQESLGVIEILDHVFVDGPWLSDTRPFDDERHL